MSLQTFRITRAESGRTVTEVVRARLSVSWSEARRLVGTGRVSLGGEPCRDATGRVRPGQRLEIRQSAEVKGKVTTSRPLIRFVDAHVVVVDKPAGLTTMRHPEETASYGPRGRRFLPPTLADQLPKLLSWQGSGRVRAVHRLDKDTSGLVVFARSAAAESHLGKQFRRHTVSRRYVAVVRGRATGGRIESCLVPDRGDGRRGSARQPGQGKRAVTHVRVLEDLGEFTVVECVLETGRTHQVRIHLGESGTPLCGEHVYDRPLHGRHMVEDPSGFHRPALHAAGLGFEHPATSQHLSWTSPLPPDMADLVARLRRANKNKRNKKN
jgi:23S rRNA pseudouridine1911/1915/1917 synthase